MSTKYFPLSIEALGHFALTSILEHEPNLNLIPRENILFRTPSDDKVSILVGSGSGHEPAFAAYVGKGMLTASVSGDVFASPSASQIRTALMAVQSKRGVLAIVNSSMTDFFNFGIATEKILSLDTFPIRIIIVQDDLTSPAIKPKINCCGKRGITGSVLISKILGAAIESDSWELDAIAEFAESITKSIASVSITMNPETVPGIPYDCGSSKPNFNSNQPIETAMQAMRPFFSQVMGIIQNNDYCKFEDSDPVVIMINNFGSIANLEVQAFASLLLRYIRETTMLSIRRIYVGNYFSYLNGEGLSVTLFNTNNTTVPSDKLISYLDMPTEASGWHAPSYSKLSPNGKLRPGKLITTGYDDFYRYPPSDIISVKERLGNMIYHACKCLIKAEPLITQLDAKTGTGDCGKTFAYGAHAVLNALDQNRFNLEDPVQTLSIISDILDDSMHGNIGVLCSIFCIAYAKGCAESKGDPYTAAGFALERLATYTLARPGDKTCIDAVAPFVAILLKNRNLSQAVEVAEAAAEETKNLPIQNDVELEFGKKSPETLPPNGVPDPGATAVSILFRGLLNGCNVVNSINRN